jgi:hypothetical protein
MGLLELESEKIWVLGLRIVERATKRPWFILRAEYVGTSQSEIHQVNDFW